MSVPTRLTVLPIQYEGYKLRSIAEDIMENAGPRFKPRSRNQAQSATKTALEIVAEAHGLDVATLEPKPPRFLDLWVFTLPPGLVRAIWNAPTTYRDYVARSKARKAAEEAERKELEEQERIEAEEKAARKMEEEARKKKDEERKARRRAKAVAAGEEAKRKREEFLKRGDPFGARSESFGSAMTEDSEDGSNTEGASGLRQRKSGDADDDDSGPKLNVSPDWTALELSKLSTLTKKYPGGTAGRWVRIANELNRSVDAVVDMASKISENPRLLTEGYKGE